MVIPTLWLYNDNQSFEKLEIGNQSEGQNTKEMIHKNNKRKANHL